ncbi:GFA family protein [Sphingobium subterraneum]|uniref:CENP-V/GFA domain-containing protein n=1 Tax=Sphingobium subterraneum TaxID=627688 RepID=A0A841J287_9SPHN|nr:GFA family protein [Sphingobium subterraneum]MBB6124814.1 hypothetical protein [Sphingobium subterraneum]
MLALSCHCGEVTLVIARKPDFIHACNCTLCAKTGAHWGYFDPSEVTVTGTASAYSRTDKGDPAVAIRFCGHCGSTTHFAMTESGAARYGNSMMGVNMRLADEQDLSGVERRYPDGRGWSGEGAFSYVRDPEIIGGADV